MPSLTKIDPKRSFNLEIEAHEHKKETLLENAPDEEEVHHQKVFQDHIIIELEKVAFFFKENYEYNLQRFEKIKVNF